jgi:hypothetical protein
VWAKRPHQLATAGRWGNACIYAMAAKWPYICNTKKNKAKCGVSVFRQGSIMRRAGYRAEAGKQDMDGFEGRLRAEGTRNGPRVRGGGEEARITTMLRLSGVLLLCVQAEERVLWWMRRSHQLATARRWG